MAQNELRKLNSFFLLEDTLASDTRVEPPEVLSSASKPEQSNDVVQATNMEWKQSTNLNTAADEKEKGDQQKTIMREEAGKPINERLQEMSSADNVE